MRLLETPLWELRHWVHHRLLVCVSIGGQQAQLVGARVVRGHQESPLLLGRRCGFGCGAWSWENLLPLGLGLPVGEISCHLLDPGWPHSCF